MCGAAACSTASTSRITLDLDCPVPWPGSLRDAACHVDCSSLDQSIDVKVQGNRPTCEVLSSSSISARYLECLYLGEAHSPFGAFMAYILHPLDCKGHQHEAGALHVQQIRSSLIELLLNHPVHEQTSRKWEDGMKPDRLMRLHRAGADAVLPANAAGVEHNDGASDAFGAYELKLIWQALRSGPGAAVNSELQERLADERRQCELQEEQGRPSQPEEQEMLAQSRDLAAHKVAFDTPKDGGAAAAASRHGSKARRWIQAMQAREIQLQALLLLCLLQISVDHPIVETVAPPPAERACSTATEAAALQELGGGLTHADGQVKVPGVGSEQNDDKLKPKTKRKRKDAARRWTAGLGSSAGFPWAGQTSTISPRTPGGTNPSTLSLGTDAAALAHRFEAVAERLALLGVTTSLSMELGLGLTPSRPSASCNTPTMVRNRGAQFGSAARPKEPEDIRDDLQWLWQDVMKPYFGAKLPRQVAFVRARAFATSYAASTPARPDQRGEGSEGDQKEMANAHAVKEGECSSPRSRQSGISVPDLVTLNTTRESQQSALAAEQASKRPKLEDALRTESRSQQRDRGSLRGSSANLRRSGAREVSVGGNAARGRKSWEKSASCTAVDLATSNMSGKPSRSNTPDVSSREALSTQLGPTLFMPPPGSAKGHGNLGRLKAPARRLDKSRSVSTGMSQSLAESLSARASSAKQNGRTGSVFKRSESQPMSELSLAADSSRRSSGVSAPELPLLEPSKAADSIISTKLGRTAVGRPAAALGVSTAKKPFTRSESQPAGLMGMSSTSGSSNAIMERSTGSDIDRLVLDSTRATGTSLQPAHHTTRVAGTSDEEEEEEEEVMMISRKRRALPSFGWSTSSSSPPRPSSVPGTAASASEDRRTELAEGLPASSSAPTSILLTRPCITPIQDTSAKKEPARPAPSETSKACLQRTAGHPVWPQSDMEAMQCGSKRTLAGKAFGRAVSGRNPFAAPSR
ncbi:hypothetical protein IE81DRAFT_368714 [Ceraceosorus guamensis]|uniref:Uncharacterized protein n=1 Tax=Ceraceosorus guamensis TaxID=1522189 RepID=A0A316VRP9_9BASI|nr:hypothetical protein IE81DRAFT_368714 [Ceraceosorus guamensis]PWN39894.1 hypothetical protein IE81DRAFT_368714 [Ceraceosorus guamensis]